MVNPPSGLEGYDAHDHGHLGDRTRVNGRVLRCVRSLTVSTPVFSRSITSPISLLNSLRNLFTREASLPSASSSSGPEGGRPLASPGDSSSFSPTALVPRSRPGPVGSAVVLSLRYS